ncbi:MAG: ABC transporter ATP-binding protein [Acholeplasmataceae bacterium]|nr:ABC transporter ATP-binding protein [Acholeplasmataceae bacterium]
MEKNIIEMRNITKAFPGIIANDNITFELRKGEIHALLGENGAGKSTLMSILFGMYTADSGQIYKNGEPISILSPNDANDHGIGMVHQHFKLVEVFSVLDNIILGVEKTKNGIISRKEIEKELLELCEKYELQVDPNAIIENISVGMQQRTEILKMLYRENEILIFDEPTAVLTPQEIDQLMITMKNLAAEGKSIIFITHKLDEIVSVCDRVTVLRRGKLIKTLNVSETNKEELSYYMVGRDVDFTVQKKESVIGDNVLMLKDINYVDDFTKKHVLKDISFKVNRGEIVCLAGIDGNGQTELGYVISGLLKPTSGEIYLNYVDVTKKSIRYRNDNGMSHIPEDRHRYGLILEESLSNNLSLKKYHLAPYQKHGLINQKEIDVLGEKLIKDFDIRSGRRTKSLAGHMSGGNQQKAIIAREIDKDSDFILAIQTVRGLDVGAVEFAHKKMIEERDKGKGILMISLDLDEVFSVSDRVLVIYEGEIVKDILTKDVTVNELGLYMAGVKKDKIPEVKFDSRELKIVKERSGVYEKK